MSVAGILIAASAFSRHGWRCRAKALIAAPIREWKLMFTPMLSVVMELLAPGFLPAALLLLAILAVAGPLAADFATSKHGRPLEPFVARRGYSFVGDRHVCIDLRGAALARRSRADPPGAARDAADF